MAYFRKVNFLHLWVEAHVLDGRETNCDDVPMNLEQIAGLAQTCEQVLADPTKGPDVLPTGGRFFFGSTEYDDYYLDDVRDVLAACQQIISLEIEANANGLPPAKLCYWSSW